MMNDEWVTFCHSSFIIHNHRYSPSLTFIELIKHGNIEFPETRQNRS